MTASGISVELPLHPTVVNALWQARSEAGTRPVDTRDLWVALMRVDTTGNWDRITEHCGDPGCLARKVVVDPAATGTAHWDGIRLTDTCAQALRTAVELARSAQLQGVPAGMLALGLITDSSTAAAQVLHDGLGQQELLDIVRADILGSPLPLPDRALSTAQRPIRSAPTRSTLCCLHCGATPATAVTVRSHRGFILWMQFVRVPGPFCRNCGLATLRRMTVESLWLGWWGPLSLFINMFTLLSNSSAHSRITELPPPNPGSPGRPMDPGKPVLRRPLAIAFLLLVIVLLCVKLVSLLLLSA
ncbi:hypothetical protein [Nocardia sp. NPDC050717]|uniref:hypothetical protein n=1 Tax=Nocardia sp. NPDC050717 TaxID=3157221 RepID=UPI00340EAA03